MEIPKYVKEGFHKLQEEAKVEKELKTLKDIEAGHVDTAWMSGEATEGYPAVNSDELKQEAIKDIKEFDRLPLPREEVEWQKFLNKFVFNEDTHQAVRDYIKWKFNITEEDLR